MKSITDSSTLEKRSIQLPRSSGRLVPLCIYNSDDEILVRHLAKWREDNAFAFPTRFPVTIEGTARWIHSNILEKEDRILFLVENPDSIFIGHMGFANCINENREMEIDNVVRGLPGISPGLMTLALKALMRWANDVIHPHLFSLRVFSDNMRAVQYYKRAGFVEKELLPLRRRNAHNCDSYLPVAEGDVSAPDGYFSKMVYNESDASRRRPEVF